MAVQPASLTLVQAAKQGDESAFELLLQPLLEQAYRLACVMLHDHHAAEDAVQEAALKAWLKVSQLREGSEMRPWFLAIVANQCRTIARGRWWSVLRLDLPFGPSSGGVEDEVVRGADVRAALRKLSPDHREVLVLHYFLDLPLDEVAAVAGIPIGTAKSRINRGIAAMRPFFELVEALT